MRGDGAEDVTSDTGSVALRAVRRTLVTGPAAANWPWQWILGRLRNLVRGILGKRCHNKFWVICADMKEDKTINLKGFNQTGRWIKSSSCVMTADPMPVCTTRKAMATMGWSVLSHHPCNPNLPLSDFYLFWPHEGFTPRMLFCRQRWPETLYVKCLDPAAKSFLQLACSCAEVDKVCSYNEGDFV
jgi:hypothetical protein